MSAAADQDIEVQTRGALIFRAGTYDLPSYMFADKHFARFDELSVFEITEAEHDLAEMEATFKLECDLYRAKLVKRRLAIEAESDSVIQ